MQKKEKLYEGKAKILYQTDQPQILLQYFKDDATAFNGVKSGQIVDKGVFNCSISTIIFQALEQQGIATHFIEKVSDREMLIKAVKIIPVEVVVRNVAAGSLVKRMGCQEGEKLSETLVEWYYKNDELGDPLIGENHIRTFGIASSAEIKEMEVAAKNINNFLVPFFAEKGLDLVDYKLEFGRTQEDKIILADEISPDSCRLWDQKTGEKLDKDRFRFDLGKVEEAYQTVLARVQ